jgi:hypothetical protein
MTTAPFSLPPNSASPTGRSISSSSGTYFGFTFSLFDATVLKVDTKEQWADYLTKGLNRVTFERIHKLVQEW